jgi:hypothetical protein
MAITRRLVVLSIPFVALAAQKRKKDRDFEGGTIKVVEIAVRRSDGSDRLLTIDGHLVNSGPDAIRELVLIFDVMGVDDKVVNRQRGKVEEDPLAPGQESEFHWQMRDQSDAVEIRVRAIARDERAVKVEEPGPYPIE